MQGGRILLVEDDHAITTVIRVALEAEGARLDAVSTLKERNAKLAEHHYDLLITDVILPDGNGLAQLSALVSALSQPLSIIVLSAQNTLDTAVRAEAEGAFEYLPKPFDLDELIIAARSALSRVALSDSYAPEGHARAPALDADLNTGLLPIIGRDPAMQLVYRTLARVAPTDLSVLILGESGTGKELAAEAIHQNSLRKSHRFVAVNMAAIPRELIESELFGHEKGAFTGAHARSIGRFEQAQGGTLFLDEIGDMPFEAQTRLLRVLQSGEYSPVGSSQTRKANVRILAATNQDLSELVKNGRFREDLFYRLNVIPLQLPALRERRSDIPLLVTHFLKLGSQRGLPVKSITKDALALLRGHDWPGNVRELSNSIQRITLLSRHHEITADDVRRLLTHSDSHEQPHATSSSSPSSSSSQADFENAVRAWIACDDGKKATQAGTLYQSLITLAEHELIETVIAQNAGNQIKAAARLGINRNTLRVKRRPKPDSDRDDPQPDGDREVARHSKRSSCLGSSYYCNEN